MSSSQFNYEPLRMSEGKGVPQRRRLPHYFPLRKAYVLPALIIATLLVLVSLFYVVYNQTRYASECAVCTDSPTKAQPSEVVPPQTPPLDTHANPPLPPTIPPPPLPPTIPPPPQGIVFKLKCDEYDQDSLVDALQKLVFKNYGIVKSTDRFVWSKIPCSYLESQNVTGPYVGWADTGTCNYLYQLVGNDLIHPPSGMRSSVPLGGIATGVFELRGDGSFHEWTIFNQHPAGAAKMQLIDDVFMGVRTVVHGDDSDSSRAYVLQTHPSNNQLPGVTSLEYKGAHPMAKLTVLDTRVPVDVSVYAYPWYKHNDMNASATPSVAFTAVLRNPLDDVVTASFMLNLPVGMEPRTQRVTPQMPKFVPITPTNSQYDPFQRYHYSDVESTFVYDDSKILLVKAKNDELGCFTSCNEIDLCLSWSYDTRSRVCTMYSDVRMNGHDDSSFSGVKSSWSHSDECVTVTRDTPGYSTGGSMSLCAFSQDDDLSISFGVSNDVTTLWKQFADVGEFSGDKAGSYVSGAVSGQVTLKPGETKEVTIVLGWYFPERDFLGIPVGNYYKHLVMDSEHAAKLLARNRVEAVSNISKLHSTFFNSDIPVTFQDMLINSLSHIRSAFWLADGRWRQWEAHDCVNIDSVHNDGERHIPYIMVFPDSLINKMNAWAGFQLKNGMIQEQVRCGCQGLPIYPITVEFGCGRKMSDVSSMFIVYLLELLQWHPGNTTNDVVRKLWPNARLAAEWHMNISVDAGMPKYLVTTYDVLGLVSYPYAAYNGAFHLLAMKAAERLANWMNDTEFAIRCNEAFIKGQDAIDKYLWNETAQYYNAYSTTEEEFDVERFFNITKMNFCAYPQYRTDNVMYDQDGKEICVESLPTTPGAIMTDTFYAQVLAYSLGLGTLVKHEDRLRSHMKAELKYNDSPYGMLVMTGRYPTPSSPQDNAVWMMGNPNWATISLHLGEDPNEALEVAKKPFEQWRSVLHEQWNVAGILGGMNYNAKGLPYITSHYGYYMSSWHIILALSGQDVDVNRKKLTFNPKIKAPFKLPVILPTVWGQLESNVAPVNMSRPNELHVFHTLSISFGTLEISELSVGACQYALLSKSESIRLTNGMAAEWQCPH